MRCKKNIFYFFFTSDLSKEQMQSNKFSNECSSTYAILQQRVPQNHRTGFVIGRTVQAQTGNPENDWGYAGGKKQTHTISQGPCVATPRGSLGCHSFQDHTKRYPLSSLLTLKSLSMPNQLTYYLFSLPHPFSAVPSHSSCFPVTLYQT